MVSVQSGDCASTHSSQGSWSFLAISTNSLADAGPVQKPKFIANQRPASSFSILSFAGTALVRLHSFPPETVLALRGHLSRARLLLRFRERDEDNFCELTLNGKPWFNPKSVRSEKLLVGIIDILHRHGHNFVSNLDYGRNQGDRIIMAFSRAPRPPPLSYQQPVRLQVLPVFAISFISEDHLRVITPPQQSAPAILQTVRGSWPRGVLSEKKVAENVYEFKLKGYGWFQEHTFATDSLRHTLSLLGSLDSFGYTLLTSLSLNGRTRSKDLWVFAGLSQTKPRELQPSGPLVSRTDRAREPGQTRPTAHSTTANNNNRPSHTGTVTKNSPAPLSHSLSQSSISSKSSIVQRLVPRAQLPPAPLSHTSSQTSVSSESSVVRRSVPRAQLAPAHSSHDLSPGPISSQLNSVQKPAPRAQLPPPSSYNPPPGSILPKSSIVQMQKPAQRDQLPVSVAKSVTSDHGVYDGHLSPQIAPLEELRMRLQSSVGSAVDMASTVPQKYRIPGGANVEPRLERQSSFGDAGNMTGVGTPKYGRTSKVDLEFEVELQSSVGSAVDMTGIGTQMYGRTAVAKRQNSNVPAATVTKVSQPSQSPRTRGQTEIPSTTEEANTSSIPLPLRTSRSSLKASSQPGPSRDSASTAKPTQGEVDMPPNWTSGWRWDGRSNCSVRSCDANENVSPGQRTPASAEAKQPKRLRDLRRHNHVLSIESRMKTQSLEKSIFISNM